MTKAFTVLLIFAAYLLAAFFKFNAFWQAPGFEKDHRSFYWTESAMHYYMADQTAKGISLGELDTRAQHPEGIVLDHDIAPAMPFLAGTLYRWFSPAMPLDIFIAYLFLFYSSLTVVGVYLWARMIFPPGPRARFAWPAVAAAFLYAVSAPSFVRSAGAFIKEDLALPMLLLGFYFLFSAWNHEARRTLRAVAAGVLISVALLSWHFSQFMLLCFSATLVLSVVVNGLFKREERDALALFTGILVATALTFPMLRATAFVCSPAMALLYAVLAYHYADNFQRTRRDALTAAVFLLSILIYFKSGLAEQSHVFRLVLDKIRFALIKPADPTLLSYESRSNWIEDFNTPGLYFILYTVSFFLPLGILGLVRLARRRRNRAALFVCAYGTIFLIFFVMARRMITIDIIFLSIATAGLLTFANRRVNASIAALLVGVFIYEGWKSLNYNEPNLVALYLGPIFPGRDLPEAFTVAEHADLLNWIRVNVKTDEPVLASMGLSPVILAYTGRPILIHSMFDAKVMRDKVQAYVEALYSTEDRFHEFARENGAVYFIYESKNLLMDGPNSDRYVAGLMQPPRDSAVFNFQFHPENLKHFRLAYQNTAYRVYVMDRPALPAKILAQPVYDERILDGDQRERLIGFIQSLRNQTLAGFAYGGRGEVPVAIKFWEEVKRQAPYVLDIHAQLCLGYVITKDMPAATANCRTQLELLPHSPIGHYHQALLLEQTGNPAGAVAELETVLRIDPRDLKAERLLKKLR